MEKGGLSPLAYKGPHYWLNAFVRMNYATYQPEDFATDERFIRWVLEPTSPENSFWQNWLVIHPEQEIVIADARQLVLGMTLKPHLPGDELMAGMWEQIEARRKPVSPFRSIIQGTRQFRIQWQVAASVALLLVSASLYWFVVQPKTVSTDYGEFRIIELPDGSLITLNGNSRLQYSRFWDNQKSREVWLEGEAFFDIRKKPQQGAYSHFVAHAGPSAIGVLGTQFNVRNRRGQIEVMLKEGKVTLQPDERSVQGGITMKPGDVVSIAPNTPVRLTRAQTPDQFTAWQERKLVFDDRSLGDIAHMLEDTYGVPIKFADPELSRLRLKGTVYAKDIDTALEAIALSFDLQFVRDKDTILIRQR